MKMKSTYEKPSEKKKRVQTENLKRIKKLQNLKTDIKLNERTGNAIRKNKMV